MSVTDDELKEFKERMRIEDSVDDGYLTRVLNASVLALQTSCGDYDMTNQSFKELVFERSRYAYNDALEYFNANFLTEINTLGVKKALEEIGTG